MKAFGIRSLEWPALLLLPVVLGYITMTRSFAYLGIAPIFIGEATLGMLLVFRPSVILGTWYESQLWTNRYRWLANLAAIFVLFGFLQCARGVFLNGNPKIALQNFAFNFYIAFLFAGMWLGERYKNLLPRVVWYLAWINGLYGILYLVFFGGLTTVDQLESAHVPLFGQPAGSAIAILGLLAYERDWRRFAVPLMLNGFVMLGMQMRAEWLGFMVAIVTFSLLTRQMSRLFQAGMLVCGLLLLGLMIDFEIPAPTGRGGMISSREIIGRAIAAVDESLAAELTPEASSYAGTVEWRLSLWRNLLRVVNSDPMTTLFGMGYGYPIWEHNEANQLVNPSPHNIFIFVIVYTGWAGALIFYTLQFCLARNLWKAGRVSGQPFGFCLWLMLFMWAHFDNKLETPFGAIPFYVLLGIALTAAIPTSTNLPEQQNSPPL